jgi:hypothetical protein
MGIFGPLHGFAGVLQRLSGMLVPGQVIFFSVVRGGSAVRVRGELVEFGSSLMRVVWHSVSQLCYPLHPRAVPFFGLFNIGHSRRANLPRLKLIWIVVWSGTCF